MIEWDIKKDDEIKYFDPELSYEVTGYRPIDSDHGLDFEIDEFIEVRNNKIRSGKYCPYIEGSKQYRDFWDREYDRCNNGFTNSKGYTITGDNYFFLNYYKMKIVVKRDKNGTGRNMEFPYFIIEQYKYFHYIELCRILKKNAVGLKSRGVGFSEIGASIVLNSYETREGSRCVVSAHLDKYVEDIVNKKIWVNMNILDAESDGGMRKLRQVINRNDYRRSSAKTKDGIEEGFMSEIEAITADEPDKIRGDRTDILLYEESGSWPGLDKAWVQGDALTEVGGDIFGIKLAWGTGGDSGSGLESLAEMFLNPDDGFNILPYRHNCTTDGSYILTGFFVPAYNVVFAFMDHRGYTDPVKGREFYENKRKAFTNPEKLVIHTAEYCFTPDDALALEGKNDFNKVVLSEQSSIINVHHAVPDEYKIKTGYLEYTYTKGCDKPTGVHFIEHPSGKVQIVEHPIMEYNYVPDKLYIAGIDGIDSGMNQTSDTYKDPSQFCIVVKKRLRGMDNPMYVCMYKDRPRRIEEAYKIALKILMYYNCKALVESTKIGFILFLQKEKLAEKYLMRRPDNTMPDKMNTSNKRRTNTPYGCPAPPNVIYHQLELISEFVEDYYHTIWFNDIIVELLKYNYENKRKFDIVAALGMCELADESLYGIAPKVDQEKKKKKKFNFGFWEDHNGVKHFGKIPEKEEFNFGIHLEDTEEYSSNPMYNDIAAGLLH